MPSPTAATAKRADEPKPLKFFWVAVKELNLSYHFGETLLFTIYIYIPIMVTYLKFLVVSLIYIGVMMG